MLRTCTQAHSSQAAGHVPAKMSRGRVTMSRHVGNTCTVSDCGDESPSTEEWDTDGPTSDYTTSAESKASTPESDPVKTLRAIASLRDGQENATIARKNRIAELLKAHGRHLYCERCGVQGKIAQESKGKGKQRFRCRAIKLDRTQCGMIHGINSLEKWLDHVSNVETEMDYAIATGAWGVKQMQEHLAFHASNAREHHQRPKGKAEGAIHRYNVVSVTAADNPEDGTVFLDTGSQDQDDQEWREQRTDYGQNASEAFVQKTYDFVFQRLQECPHIASSAKELLIPPELRVLKVKKGSVRFRLLEEHFDLWKREHEAELGIELRLAKITKLKRSENKEVNETYLCNYYGKRREPREDHTAPQLRTLKRKRKRQSFKCGCKGRLNKSRKIVVVDNRSIPVIDVLYAIGHNHPVFDISNIGSRRISQEAKAWIEEELLKGVSPKEVMRRSTEALKEIRDREIAAGKRPHRDHYISYMDIYNVYYRFFRKTDEESKGDAEVPAAEVSDEGSKDDSEDSFAKRSDEESTIDSGVSFTARSDESSEETQGMSQRLLLRELRNRMKRRRAMRMESL